MKYSILTVHFLCIGLTSGAVSSAAVQPGLSRRGALPGDKPDGTILPHDIDGDHDGIPLSP